MTKITVVHDAKSKTKSRQPGILEDALRGSPRSSNVESEKSLWRHGEVCQKGPCLQRVGGDAGLHPWLMAINPCQSKHSSLVKVLISGALEHSGHVGSQAMLDIIDLAFLVACATVRRSGIHFFASLPQL